MELKVYEFLFFAPDGGKWSVPRSSRLFPAEVDLIHVTGDEREG